MIFFFLSKFTVQFMQQTVRYRFILHSCGHLNKRCICDKSILYELPIDERKNKRQNPHDVFDLGYTNTIYMFFANVVYAQNLSHLTLDPKIQSLGIIMSIKTKGVLLKINDLARIVAKKGYPETLAEFCESEKCNKFLCTKFSKILT